MDRAPASAADSSQVRQAPEDTQSAGELLRATDGVLSVAQLGTRLHVLMALEITDALARIKHALDERHIAATAEPTHATLEDVFVASTGFSHREEE